MDGDNVKTTSGSGFFIGTATAPGTGSPPFNPVDDDYLEVGEVENFGEFGDEANAVNFLAVKAGRVRKLKGSKDAGSFPLVCGRDPQDVGQQAMDAAAATKNNYNIMVELDDAPQEGWSGTAFYFRALIMSARNNLGGADDVTKKTYNIAINSEITEVPPAPLSP